MSRQHFRHFIFYPIIALTLVIFLTWVATPFVVKHYLTEYIEEQGQGLSLEKLSIDFFPPKIDIKSLQISDGHTPNLSLENAVFEVKVWPLLRRTVYISQADIHGLAINIEQQASDWIVAGINTAQFLSEPTQPEDILKPTDNVNSKNTDSESTDSLATDESTSSPWSINLPFFSFTDSEFQLTRQVESSLSPVTDTFGLKKLIIKDVSGQESDWQGNIELNAFINNATFSMNSQFDYSPTLANVTLEIDDTLIPIDSLKHFIPSPFNQGKGEIHFQSNVDLQLTNIDSSPSAIISKLDLEAGANDLDLHLDQVTHVQTQSSFLSITDASVDFQSAEQLSAKGKMAVVSTLSSASQEGLAAEFNQLNFSHGFSVTKSNDDITANSHNIEFSIEETKASQSSGEKVTIQSIQLVTEALSATLKAEQDSSLSVSGLNLSVKALDSFLAQNKRALSFDETKVTALDVSQKADLFDVSLSQVSINNIKASENIAELTSRSPLPALAQIGKITISDVHANQAGAEIDTITVDSVNTHVVVTQDQSIENLIVEQTEPDKTQTAKAESTKETDAKDIKIADAEIPIEESSTQAPNNSTSKNSTSENNTSEPPYYIVLNRYETIGDSSLSLQDKSVSPAINMTLDLETLSLQNLNTQNKDQATNFVFKARSGQYATIDNTTTIWPLADQLTLQSTLTVKEFELPPFSPYIASSLGYQIDTGQMDIDLTVNSNEGILEGNAGVLLRRFNLGGAQESATAVKTGAIPLNIAIGVLKDSDDNIDLDIPLSGDINNPEFGWQGFLVQPLRKSLYKASSYYLMQTFVPYSNLISVAQFAGEQLLKVRVEPLVFTPKDGALNTSQDAYLTELIQLMKDKPDSQLQACGIANHQDLGLIEIPDSLSNLDKTPALELAQQRSESVKAYLVNNDIESSRILLCSPEIDLSSDSQPRVELDF